MLGNKKGWVGVLEKWDKIYDRSREQVSNQNNN